ncbi:MAG: hypothetical protein AAB325_09735 [Pseudomonadota bacterium]
MLFVYLTGAQTTSATPLFVRPREAVVGGCYAETSFVGIRLGKVTTARPLAF